MTNYREILRLHSLGLNKTEIASELPLRSEHGGSNTSGPGTAT